jgi:hypothetical protein
MMAEYILHDSDGSGYLLIDMSNDDDNRWTGENNVTFYVSEICVIVGGNNLVG